MHIGTKAQLRNPLVQRWIGLTEQGYIALNRFKTNLEDQLGRDVSESVAIDVLLTKDHTPYIPRK